MEKMGFGNKDEKDEYAHLKDRVLESLRERFRPEFINRLDEIIVFNVLTTEAIKKIVEIQVKNVTKRLADKEIQLTIADEVYAYLSKEGYNPQYGARPLKRLIQNKILTPVASLMISQGVMEGGTVSVSMKENEIVINAEKRAKSKVEEKKGREKAGAAA